MKIRISLHLLTIFFLDLPSHINASLSLEECFTTCLDNIYLLFLTIWSPWHALVFITNFYYYGSDETNKIMFYLFSLV